MMTVRSFLLSARPYHPEYTARRIIFGACLLGLSACADGAQPQHFSPPDFSYLTPLHLNVASIDVQDQAVPTPDSLSAHAPTPPDTALKILAQQRLASTGSSGQGQFIIKQAYLQKTSDDAVDGALDVQLNVADANNQHTGYVHARVTRHFTSTDQTASSPAALDALTKNMTQDMNVELEYQIRHRLTDWLTDAEGNPLTGSIQQQSLTPPGITPQQPVAVPTNTSPAQPVNTSTTDAPTQSTPSPTSPKAAPPSDIPDAIFPTGQDNTSSPMHSPQPQTLKLPTTNATPAQ